MGIISRIGSWIKMQFLGRAKEAFDVKPITSDAMTQYIRECGRIYEGHPDWVDPDNQIRTFNFAKTACAELARLTMLDTKITIDGSARATWLQEQIDKVYKRLCGWVEYGCAYGTIILKPNGKSIDAVTPDRFIVTDCESGEITGIVFVDKSYDARNKKYYTRLEYHRFENELYRISNRCYISDSASDNYGDAVAIERTPWAGMLEDATIENVTEPLYGVLRMPAANNIDMSSPLGLPIFAGAINELRDYDVANSRMQSEIYDSRRMVLIDSDIMFTGIDNNRAASRVGGDVIRERAGLPDYVKIMQGTGQGEVYHEINPTLNTEMRLVGLRATLTQLGYKLGFSNGYFVSDERPGIQTATGVEADQQRTIQTVKNMRDAVESCLDGLLSALNTFADLYGYAPVGVYNVVYDFADITYNHEEDRARWAAFANSEKIPFWYYLTQFEGLAEDEAKALTEEAEKRQTQLSYPEEL